MKKLMATTVLFLALTTTAFAADTIYHIFADGLACRYCVLGVDKQLRKIKGVEWVDIHLERGLVNVRVAEGFELTEAQMKTLFDNAGVTFRRMEHHPTP